jgi:hypothetical protein
MRTRFRGGRGSGNTGDLSTGEGRGFGGNQPGNTAFWITIIGFLGGAAVRDLARPDSRIRALGQRLLNPGIKLLRPGKEARVVEDHADGVKVIETVQ